MTKRRLTRRQHQVRRNRIILACAAAALLIIIIVIISVSMKGCSKSKKTDKNGESTTAKVEESTQTKENENTSEEVSSTDTSSSIMSDATSVSASSDSSEFAPPVVPSGNTVSKGTTSKGFQIQEINGATYIDGVLIANKTYALPQDFIPTNPDQPVNADRSSTCLDKTLMSAWNTMLKDATAKGLNIYIASGYRSYNYQVNVYNRYVKSDGAAVADGTAEAVEAAKADLIAGKTHVYDITTFTVDGKTLDSYEADIDTDPDYTPDHEVVSDGYFHESDVAFRSAPYFNVRIDGINLLDEQY
jgi:D-alanyl-D-alanine carboxypeptidase